MTEQRPTALDLMKYADGELEADRVAMVEQYIRKTPSARAWLASMGMVGDEVRSISDAHAKAAGADNIADSVMAAIEEADAKPSRQQRLARLQLVDPPRPVASPQRTFVIAAAALALAAAAAFVVWQSVGPNIRPVASSAPTATPSTSTIESALASATPQPDNDPEPAVSVDLIEFGAHTGTIFYVPSDQGTTAVVWLSDDDAEGAKE